MRMIYFGKRPTESVTIAEVRQGLNIYTREDLVYSMRELADGEIRFLENPLIENYRAKIREFPANGVKLKHPAISLLRGKRLFDTLIDDSGTTFEMLGGLPGFTVLQPPSARPPRTLNFTLGSPQRYLDRMANGYVRELAEILSRSEPLSSRRLSPETPAPDDYPAQRFAIAIAWDKFGPGFVAPARELRALGKRLAKPAVPAAIPVSEERPPLSLETAQLQRLTDRLHREFDLLLEERAGDVSVEANHTLMLRDLVRSSPEDFQAMLDRFFTGSERESLPGAERPLADRGPNYFAQVASLMAAKKAVCNLLALDPAQHSHEVGIRYGRPVLTGTAAQRLGGNQLMTTLAEDGEVGIGIALIEPSIWESGVVGIGLHLTNDRVRYTEASRHALAEAAYKATYPVHPVRRFTHHRAEEVVPHPEGGYALTGKTLAAARELRGDAGNADPLRVRSLDFRIGDATVALVAVPSLNLGRRPRPWLPPLQTVEGAERNSTPALNPVYLVESGGRYELPRGNMQVVIMGDMSGTRAIDLVREGHFPVTIDRDPEMLEMAQRLLESFSKEFERNGATPSTPRVEFLLGDWYQTSVQADRVEAYFPLHVGDLPMPRDPLRLPAIQRYLEQALISKIVPGGGAYVVSENEPFIRDLASLVAGRSDLELVETNYKRKNIPIVAGFAVHTPYRLNSWVVFRRKP